MDVTCTGGHPGPLFFVNLIILLKCNLIISLFWLILEKRPYVVRQMDLVFLKKKKKIEELPLGLLQQLQVLDGTF